MNKSPFLNALAAALYIVFVVFAIDKLGSAIPKETILVPITMLSLFVLSAAVMSYLFVYEPLRLHLDNQRNEAVSFFLKTVLTFAGFVVLFLIFLLYR